MPHSCSDLLKDAVYGLPEINREKIKKASLVANPGCYPTAIQLGFIPLIESGVIDLDDLIADAKSGVSGAGRKAEVNALMGRRLIILKHTVLKGIDIYPKSRKDLWALRIKRCI